MSDLPMKALIWVAIVLGLAGCAKGGVSFGPGELDLPACGELAKVPVDQLEDLVPAKCDLEGSYVVFPGGREVSVPEGGGLTIETWGDAGGPSDTYTVINLGVFGVVAAITDADRTASQWWGDPASIQKQQDATGEIAPS